MDQPPLQPLNPKTRHTFYPLHSPATGQRGKTPTGGSDARVCVLAHTHVLESDKHGLVLEELLHTGLISTVILSPDVPRVSWGLGERADPFCTADAGGKTSVSQQKMWGQYQPPPSVRG